jgi:hypothetical protein
VGRPLPNRSRKNSRRPLDLEGFPGKLQCTNDVAALGITEAKNEPAIRRDRDRLAECPYAPRWNRSSALAPPVLKVAGTTSPVASPGSMAAPQQPDRK